MKNDVTPGIKIGKELGDISDETLRFYSQIGVEEVGMPTRTILQTGAVPTTRPLVPAAQTELSGSQGEVWDESELMRIRERIVSFGLTPSMAFLRLSGNILSGRQGRDEDLERVKACIETAGRVGLRVLAYGFSAVRASEGYGGRYG